ncbi:MAG TPA: hypothetical protein VKV95_16210 [Terriglobia bacterium]|nr:hypothetical protein [Terriglobia bacterium]
MFPLGALSPAGSGNDASLQGVPPQQPLHAHPPGDKTLPPIPGLSDLASDRLVHYYRDPFNPPEAMNEWGIAKVTKSVSGMSAITFPPFGCCWSTGRFHPDLVTCELFLNGRLLNSYPPPAGRVTYTWYPHRIHRETEVEGLHFTTETFLPSKQRAVAESLKVKNESHEKREVRLGFDLRAGVTVTPGPWPGAPPAEADNLAAPDEARGCVVFGSQHSSAFSAQGVSPRPQRIEQKRIPIYDFSLGAGETRTFHYLNVIGGSREEVLASYDRLQAIFDQIMKENEEIFAGLLRSAFTPGNSEFSGHLPQLVTSDPALWKLYYGGFSTLLFARRSSPDSFYGTTYLTLSHYDPTLSFIWDTMLTSLSLSLLDPEPLRRLVETWLVEDMHKRCATDYLTGKAAGGSGYAVNDMGILRCAHDYVRVTGDFAWLDKNVNGKPVLEHLIDHALYWKQLDASGHGLADYTDRGLLEVVSTWVHEVAAVNAGNVYSMRLVASLLEHRGNTSRASVLRGEAKDLAARINSRLYVRGKGYWRCGLPDGSFNEVRHCFDLLTILDTMFEDLSEQQKKEMSLFFWNELYTPLWMHALSPGDGDATWNSRPDHTWLGAYPAWPPMTAKGIYKAAPSRRLSAWVRNLAKSANQGPFAQAHMVETLFPPDNGGAYKSPPDRPYANAWHCVAGGCFTDLVIDSIFGADLSLYNGIRMNSRLSDFDPNAKLLNVRYQGKSYTISRSGPG